MARTYAAVQSRIVEAVNKIQDAIDIASELGDQKTIHKLKEIRDTLNDMT